MTAPDGATSEGSALAAEYGCLELSSIAATFVGGVLRHLPALSTFVAPSANSYARVQPNCWSGGFVCWCGVALTWPPVQRAVLPRP
jgi:glutamine synthetase